MLMPARLKHVGRRPTADWRFDKRPTRPGSSGQLKSLGHTLA